MWRSAKLTFFKNFFLATSRIFCPNAKGQVSKFIFVLKFPWNDSDFEEKSRKFAEISLKCSTTKIFLNRTYSTDLTPTTAHFRAVFFHWLLYRTYLGITKSIVCEIIFFGVFQFFKWRNNWTVFEKMSWNRFQLTSLDLKRPYFVFEPP